MARVGADLGSADLGQLEGDCRIEELDAARAPASAGIVGEEGASSDKAMGDILINWLCGERPSLQISCHEKVVVPSWGKTTLHLPGRLVGQGLHDVCKRRLLSLLHRLVLGDEGRDCHGSWRSLHTVSLASSGERSSERNGGVSVRLTKVLIVDTVPDGSATAQKSAFPDRLRCRPRAPEVMGPSRISVT